MSLQIKKTKDRFCSRGFLAFVRSKKCCVCGKPATASHMISIKRADGSDALAVPACMPDHHVQSTKVSRELLIAAGIDLEKLHVTLWSEFLGSVGIYRVVETQSEFELVCRMNQFCEKAPTKRKNR